MPETEVITSRDNSKLKLSRAVRDGREEGLMFVEGIRLVREAISSRLDLELVLTSTDFDLDAAQIQIAERNVVTPRLFESVTDTANSQGIIAIARRPRSSLVQIPEGHVLLLHQVNNPSNLGAVVRTAEAAGVAGLITTTGSSNAFAPKALRGSMGSAFRLPIVEGIDFDDAILWAKERDLVSTAADIRGNTSYTTTDWRTSRLIVFGSEAHGLNERELSLMDQTINIPMKKEVESLNLAVSAGIVLFEAKRQRESA